MSGSSNSNSGTNQMAVPQAKEAMNRFKQEVASEIGVPLKDGYNGDLTSAQAGSIGGEMVKKMIMKQEEQMSGKSTGFFCPLHQKTGLSLSAGSPHFLLFYFSCIQTRIWFKPRLPHAK